MIVSESKLKLFAAVSAVVSLASGFFAAAALSEFVAQECGGIPQVEWMFAGQCQDAQAGYLGAGALTIVALGLMFVSLKRRRND